MRPRSAADLSGRVPAQDRRPQHRDSFLVAAPRHTETWKGYQETLIILATLPFLLWIQLVLYGSRRRVDYTTADLRIDLPKRATAVNQVIASGDI